MDYMHAIKELGRLWKKWGTNRPSEANIDRIQEFINKELRAAVAGVIRCTPGLISEMRGELVLCGKIRKVLQSHAV